MDKARRSLPKIELARSLDGFNVDRTLVQPGELTAQLEWVVKRSDGSIRIRKEKKAESFVRGFFDILLAQMMGLGELAWQPIKDASGVTRLVSISAYNFACNAVANTDSYGVVVGTDNTPPTINDYKLGTQIMHGSTAGKLQYGLVGFGMPTADPTTSHFTITRDFSNSSGASILVLEVGLYVYADVASPWTGRGGPSAPGDYVGRTAFPVMTLRDVISGGINVLNGETLTLNYRPVTMV